MSNKRRKVALCLAIILINQERMQKKKERRIWTKNWILRRSVFSVENNLMQELRAEDENCFKNFVRLTAEDFDYLLAKVEPIIQKRSTNMREAVSPTTRLALTLRYLATGDSYTSLMYMFRVGKSTISKIIPEVMKAIYNVLHEDYLKLPSTEEEWNAIATEFLQKWNFPNCIGAVDGKHVPIKAPNGCGSEFFNYKNVNSIILMAVADANYKFLYTNVGSKGRNADGGVYANCTFAQALQENTMNIPIAKPLPQRILPVPYCIVADDAFPLKPHIMKPYSARNQGIEVRIFNYRLSRARRIIENAFGIASSRFRVLRQTIELSLEKVKLLVATICVLHNYLITRSSHRLYAPPGYADIENDDGTITGGLWRNEDNENLLPLQPIARPANVGANEIRDEFKEYFSKEGEIYWQKNFV